MPELRSQFKTYEGLSAPRSLLHGIGLTDRDLEKPRIGVINTWSDINPGQWRRPRVRAFVRRAACRSTSTA